MYFSYTKWDHCPTGSIKYALYFLHEKYDVMCKSCSKWLEINISYSVQRHFVSWRGRKSETPDIQRQKEKDFCNRYLNIGNFFFNWWQILCTNNRVHLSKQKESHKKTENHPTVIYDLPNEKHTKQWKMQFWSRKFCLQAVCIFVFNVCSLKPSSFTENCFYVF